jgi:hypothetical protein
MEEPVTGIFEHAPRATTAASASRSLRVVFIRETLAALYAGMMRSRLNKPHLPPESDAGERIELPNATVSP